MINDPIVEEVRQEREKHAAQFNYDIDAICEDLKKQQKESTRTFITLPAKFSKKLA